MWILTWVRLFRREPDVPEYDLRWIWQETHAERDTQEAELGEYVTQSGFTYRPAVTWNIYPSPHVDKWRLLKLAPEKVYFVSCFPHLYEEQRLRGEEIKFYLANNWYNGDCVQLWRDGDYLELQHYKEIEFI